MSGRARAYRPRLLKRLGDFAFKSFVVTSIFGGCSLTAYILFKLGKYYLFDSKTYKAQRKQYAEALIEKEKREKELGLRD
ncbi:unnamed protein product [Mesocestoides corti]|uniref:Uncharacterized protein n=1 Tax=Mesocestoides corti TaxID=53468 RepID=A0A0R3U932_MESCO|nr:unnamed protein product [Mesocestoides corti]